MDKNVKPVPDPYPATPVFDLEMFNRYDSGHSLQPYEVGDYVGKYKL